MEHVLPLALALLVALATIIAVAILRLPESDRPTRTESTYWRVGDKVVERCREEGGDTFFSVDGRIVLKWDNVEPSREEVMAILKDYGVQVDIPWTLIDPQETVFAAG